MIKIKLFEEIIARKLPKLVKEKNHMNSEVERVWSKDEFKDTHRKTHDNLNGKYQIQKGNLKRSKRKTISYLKRSSH